ncbi:MAG: hypothetical protein AMXMBFR13_13030 [Phycisphaerae bacterium]
MPEISRFYGIRIIMYPNDHLPPHFHAIYAEDQAVIGIDPLDVRDTSLPPRALSLVLEWARTHQQELAANWSRLRSGQTALRVPPLL